MKGVLGNSSTHCCGVVVSLDDVFAVILIFFTVIFIHYLMILVELCTEYVLSVTVLGTHTHTHTHTHTYQFPHCVGGT